MNTNEKMEGDTTPLLDAREQRTPGMLQPACVTAKQVSQMYRLQSSTSLGARDGIAVRSTIHTGPEFSGMGSYH